jgi:CDP-diacylglycerol--glycerol-3-phosphate 3-phosphatidyltransferase
LTTEEASAWHRRFCLFSKVWGIALFAGFFGLLVMGSSGAAVSCAIYLGILADVEGVLISLALPRWQADVPTLVHALRVRRAGLACLRD